MSLINDNSLWNDPAIQATINRMDVDPEKRYRYQKMAQVLFDKVSEDPDLHTVKIDVASQVQLALRDGLHPDILDENEKQIFIEVYGLEALEEFSEPNENEDDQPKKKKLKYETENPV
jgi:hypothetical protein